jgi:hypothetical protein
MKRRVGQRRRNAGAIGLVIAAGLAIGCRKQAKPAGEGTQSLPAGTSVSDIFDLRNHPNATILKPVDLNTLTDSQRKFGIAPQRDPSVEYQPDIILMEQGDKAIRSIATDGMTWTFDANAPHVKGISVGINSLVMSALLRTMAGLGTLGFNTGVYIDVRFTGTVLRAPDIGFPCGAGTIEAYLDSGVGYAIPQWVTDAINFFLRLVSDVQIDRAGSYIKGPAQRLFHGDTQIPSGCATPK